MDYKKQIETLLETLETKGYSREEIETGVHRSSNWIDQVLARGGNQKAFNLIAEFNKAHVAKSNARPYPITTPGTTPAAHNDPAVVRYLEQHIESLRQEVDYLRGIVNPNLNRLKEGQMYIEAHLTAGLHQAAQIRAAGNRKKVEAVMEEINRDVFDIFQALRQKDTAGSR